MTESPTTAHSENRAHRPHSSLRATDAASPRVDAASYSRVVRLLKITLPLTALAIFLTVIIYSVIQKPDGIWTIKLDENRLEEGKIIMSAPRFVGSDEEGQTFEVTAVRAFQDTTFTERVALEEVVADVLLTSGLGVHIAAELGELDTKNELLALTGPIIMESSDGNKVFTNEVKVDLAQGELTGRQPIRAESPIGSITSDGFEVHRGDKRLRFVGNVRIRINPAEVANQ